MKESISALLDPAAPRTSPVVLAGRPETSPRGTRTVPLLVTSSDGDWLAIGYVSYPPSNMHLCRVDLSEVPPYAWVPIRLAIPGLLERWAEEFRAAAEREHQRQRVEALLKHRLADRAKLDAEIEALETRLRDW